MPVPKRKRSRMRRDKRFANKGIKVKAFTYCQNQACKEPLMPHVTCKKCGHYKGSKVMTTKQDRIEKRGQSRKKQAEKRKALQAKAEPIVQVPEKSE